jgi:hypothetical protein
LNEEKQQPLGPPVNVAIVAPVWLQDALLVFLRSISELKLVACVATVQVLLSLDLEQTPELIILETDKKYGHAQEQIRSIKTAWPDSHIIALIPHNGLKPFIQAADVDEVLVSGVAPEQLRQTISRLEYSNRH